MKLNKRPWPFVQEGFDADGRLIPDEKPVEVPLQYQRPESLAERMRRMIRDEFSARASRDGHESFEEADDFDVGDDLDPSTPYEVHFDPSPPDDPKPDAVVPGSGGSPAGSPGAAAPGAPGGSAAASGGPAEPGSPSPAVSSGS